MTRREVKKQHQTNKQLFVRERDRWIRKAKAEIEKSQSQSQSKALILILSYGGGGGGGGGSSTKGKSCKGCLYYSSTQKSKSKSKYPTCVGFSNTLQQVPSYIVGETELEASKADRTLAHFKYACVGYSVFLDRKDTRADPHNKQAELPFCFGLEVLYDKKPAGHTHAPTPAHKSEENSRPIPQPRTYQPAQSTRDEYLHRFKMNAALVASGVARNVNRVGNYVKQSVDDILYPYRRRPK